VHVARPETLAGQTESKRRLCPQASLCGRGRPRAPGPPPPRTVTLRGPLGRTQRPSARPGRPRAPPRPSRPPSSCGSAQSSSPPLGDSERDWQRARCVLPIQTPAWDRPKVNGSTGGTWRARRAAQLAWRGGGMTVPRHLPPALEVGRARRERFGRGTGPTADGTALAGARLRLFMGFVIDSRQGLAQVACT
jgi:hypothetical protein